MDSLDHRVIGPRLDLFHQQDDAPGAIFWHPRGAELVRLLEDYVRRAMRGAGFAEVRTPQLMARSLWERSGHWEKFGANMFAFDDGERSLALKPMSCPGHVQVFRQRPRSYRELPLRYAEFGACHRYEPSGALHGLMRTRAFTQDDAHVFCRESQVEVEVARFCALLARLYGELGFPSFEVAFSTRPALRAGSDEVWDRAEAQLSAAAAAAGLEFALNPGAGAFYGPKLEFVLADRQGRRWQCGTIQLDLVLPARLGAEFVDEDGARRCPVLIHHAVLGSLERFIAVLLEHRGGWLPFWLAPEQVVVAPVSAAQADYAHAVRDCLSGEGLRVRADDREATLARRVLDAHALAVPVFAAVGAREAASGTVSLRWPDGRRDLQPLEGLAAWLRQEAPKRERRP
jgi:threonyl-tRNA synthetase